MNDERRQCNLSSLYKIAATLCCVIKHYLNITNTDNIINYKHLFKHLKRLWVELQTQI